MSGKKFYAPTREGKPPEEWYLLEGHLEGTARKASNFAVDFNAADWAYLAGLRHER